MPFFISRAKNERNVVAGLTGMNVSDVLDIDDLQKMNARGTTFAWMPLPKPVRGRPINEAAKNLVRAFLTSAHSPVNVMFQPDLPKFIATHSTSGRIVLDLLHEEDTGRKLSRIFSGAVYASPYLDTANGSMTFDRFRDFIFQAFAELHKNKTPHETALGRLYMARTAKNESYRETKDAGMEYAHILELQNAGRNLIKNFNAKAANALPSVIVIGNKDPFACHKTTNMVAQRMGITPVVVNGGQHYPFRQDSHALIQVIEAIDLWTHHYKPRAVHSNAAATDQPPRMQQNILRSLGNGLGTALERGTGLLNPAAGIF